jgi:hypothetical protein
MPWINTCKYCGLLDGFHLNSCQQGHEGAQKLKEEPLTLFWLGMMVGFIPGFLVGAPFIMWFVKITSK